MLTSTNASLLTNKINKAFDNIGKTNGTSMPESARNMDWMAYELHVAMHLSRMADARKAAAMKQAINVGLIPNYKEQPKTPGTQATTYSGLVNVQMVVRNGRSITDTDKLIQELVDNGVDSGLVLKLFDKHTKMSAPSHIFTTTLSIEN
jgi:hypothetical protein